MAHLPISFLACGKDMVAGKKVAQESIPIIVQIYIVTLNFKER